MILHDSHFISSLFLIFLLAFSRRAQLKALETRATLQIQKLSDNNAALARMNHRLNSQLERLKGELDQLEHLTAGNAIVARAKESELASEINGLKHLLKESLAERANLHAQLVAKQVKPLYFPFSPSSASSTLLTPS